MTTFRNGTSSQKRHLRLVVGGETAGESLHFDAVCRRYARYVASIGLRILGAPEELDDLVQEVFLEAHRGLTGVRDPYAVRAWLESICVRRATRRLRRRRLRSWLTLGRTDAPRVSLNPDEDPERAAAARAALKILDRLNPDERAAWVLRHIEHESLDDIADICACSKSTVERRLRSAQERFAREAAR